MLFEHRQRLLAISNRLEDDRFVSRIRMEIGEKEKLERMKLGCTPSKRVESESNSRTRVDASRDGKTSSKWAVGAPFRDS